MQRGSRSRAARDRLDGGRRRKLPAWCKGGQQEPQERQAAEEQGDRDDERRQAGLGGQGKLRQPDPGGGVRLPWLA